MRLALALFLLLLPHLAAAQALVADLSSHLVGITTGFQGANLALFGALDGPGDVAVVLRGPPADTLVRRKDRMMGGVWAASLEVPFYDVPQFYAVASSRPLGELASTATRAKFGIGLDVLALEPSNPADTSRLTEFRGALIHDMVIEGLFPADTTLVSFLGSRLFRATVFLPANVPTGTYSVDVLLFRSGELIARQSIPLEVEKVGLSAKVGSIATRAAPLYALIGLAMAVVAGWLAGLIFGRR